MKPDTSLTEATSAILVACLSLACASGGPAVLSSTPENVSVEFSTDDKVAVSAKVANEACSAHGRIAEFDEVQSTASPETRVAKYRCVSPVASSSTAPAPAASETAPAEAPEPEAAPVTETSPE